MEIVVTNQRYFCFFFFQSSDSGGFRARRSPQTVAMATLSLRISIPEKNATKMMQFDPSTSIYDACRIIREKLAEASNMGQRKLLLAPEIFNDAVLTNTRICIFLFSALSFILPGVFYTSMSALKVKFVTKKDDFILLIARKILRLSFTGNL